MAIRLCGERYAQNQWKPLQAMLHDGRLPIHNNDVERDLRALTIGRKNWMLIGSAGAGASPWAHAHGYTLASLRDSMQPARRE
jgi:hypothetical protein